MAKNVTKEIKAAKDGRDQSGLETWRRISDLDYQQFEEV